jgi:hypothetical protein
MLNGESVICTVSPSLFVSFQMIMRVCGGNHLTSMEESQHCKIV